MGRSRSAIPGDGGRHNGDLSSADWLRHPDNIFECLVCPARKGRARIMKAYHTSAHISSGVHQRFSRAASRAKSRATQTPGLAGPVASNVMGKMWQPLPAELMTAEGGAFTATALYTIDSPPLVPILSANAPSTMSLEDSFPISGLLGATEGSRIGNSVSTSQFNVSDLSDTTAGDSDVDFVDQEFIWPNGDDSNSHADDFNIDLDAIASLKDAHRDSVSPTCSTYPWPSSALFLTDPLFSSPRLQFSEQQKKAVLNWASQLGAPNVPTYYALSRFQEKLKNTIGDSVTALTTGMGHKVYMQDIPHMIAKDYANPITRFAIWDYPIDGEGGASQVFHGSKMLMDMPSNLVVPTVCVNDRIFFVDELLQTSEGTYFIPHRFFYRLPKHAKLSGVGLTENGSSQVYEPSVRDLWSLGHKVVRTDVRPLTPDVDGILTIFYRRVLLFQMRKYASHMPHPLRVEADGRMVYTVPVILFMDDTSANISKQWNKHIVVYLSNAGLPREMLDKEFCTKFVASSPNASPMELMRAVRDSMDNALVAPAVTFDCKTGKEILTIPYLIFTASDNPMHAEQTSQAGLNANYFCRTCDVGGTRAQKKSNEGFSKIFEIGCIRDPDEMKRVIEQQLELCVLPGGSDKVDSVVRSNGIKEATVTPIINYITTKGKALRSRKSLTASQNGAKATTDDDEIQTKLSEELDALLKKQGINPLIGMPGFNMHLNTPTEILHTVLLGIVKYYWAQTIWILKGRKSMGLFQTRLVSTNWRGLNAPSTDAGYICQYHGSLIGKHFKGLAQVMPFLIYDLVAQDVLRAWNIIGTLVVLLWHTEIEDVEDYVMSLSRTIQDFLNITAKCSPGILIAKPKFHFLVHLPEFIRRFGPAVLFSTERYESFNHVFRLLCIYSNRQVPSRDSCNAFAALDRIKHVATGGYWHDPHTGTWAHAGQWILDFISTHDKYLGWLGLPKESTQKPGVTTCLSFIRLFTFPLEAL
ncbi:hypothetical protein EDB83DRAFT_2304552 [Lactarius deliciosus]|nr:hypothetical protein EDB83DRAFT_2304552 [Lactarius deliciosus]